MIGRKWSACGTTFPVGEHVIMRDRQGQGEGLDTGLFGRFCSHTDLDRARQKVAAAS